VVPTCIHVDGWAIRWIERASQIGLASADQCPSCFTCSEPNKKHTLVPALSPLGHP
jgi:hypothetical protein